MRSGYCCPVTVASQAYPGNALMCPSFPPSQAALVTATTGDKGLWVVWCSSDEVSLTVKVKGGKSSLTGLNNIRIVTVRWRASILSLGYLYSWVKTRCAKNG